MSIEVEVGTKAIVTVPASTANLGPGYDTLGMSLSMYDTAEVEVIPPASRWRFLARGQMTSRAMDRT